MPLVIPFFTVDFARIYLTMSRSDPAALGGPLTRTEALYFTVTVLSTVGFGDITPETDVARNTGDVPHPGNGDGSRAGRCSV